MRYEGEHVIGDLDYSPSYTYTDSNVCWLDFNRFIVEGGRGEGDYVGLKVVFQLEMLSIEKMDYHGDHQG